MGNGLRLPAVMVMAALAGCASHRSASMDGGEPVSSSDLHADGSPGDSKTIRCDSDHGRTRHCDIDTRNGVFLSRRVSNTPCIQGRNWDVDQTGVWVGHGCRAEFTLGGGAAPGGRPVDGAIVRCESQAGHRRHCDAPVQRGAQLRRTVSRTPCILGENWGWDASGVWVDHGCRGDFNVF